MKTTLLTAFTIAVTILFSTNTSAQNYRSGYIVQAEGDTIQGLIKYSEGNSSYKSCIFKKTEEAKAQEYFPADIKAYRLAGNAIYESKTITDEKDNEIKAFVEVLVHGSINLYEYKNLLFLEKEGNGLKLLSLETNETDNGRFVGYRTTLTTSTSHLILINSLTFDCPVPDSKMSRLLKRLNVPDVVAVVEAYNNCREPNSSISYKQDKAWVSVEKGIFLGGNTYRLNLYHGNYTLSQATFPISYNIVFGGLFNFASPRKSERFSVQVEPLYSQQRHEGTFTKTRPSYSTEDTYTVDMALLSLTSMLRYNVNMKGNLAPYFGIGMSGSNIINSDIKGRHAFITSVNGPREEFITTSRSTITSRIFFSSTAAIGTTYQLSDKKGILVQLRYEHGRYLLVGPSGGRDQTAYLSNNNNSFYLTAAYIFK